MQETIDLEIFMRERVSLIIVEDEKVLLFYRQREGRVYYITPGGGRELGETLIEAAYREAAEETSLEIVLGPKLWEGIWPDGQYETAFLVQEFNGRPRLGVGPELVEQSPHNIHRLEWHPLAALPGDLVMPLDVTAVYAALK
jgi:8-oxo-dGTP diphosphatase